MPASIVAPMSLVGAEVASGNAAFTAAATVDSMSIVGAVGSVVAHADAVVTAINNPIMIVRFFLRIHHRLLIRDYTSCQYRAGKIGTNAPSSLRKPAGEP